MIGRTLVHYKITDLVGKGAMGEVYRARDTKLDRHVAIKILPQELSKDSDLVVRFAREARTLASLQHSNIASIYGFETVEDLRFLVMEFINGEDLQQRMKRGSLQVEEALEIARGIASGLEAAHERGVVHRDLKPANIMIADDGQVKILDFGLARVYWSNNLDDIDLDEAPTAATSITKAGVVLGTAAYMSPEQARGQRVDARADLWAFGLILFEMLCGHRVFKGKTSSDVLASVLTQECPWESLPKDLPPSVMRMLRRCLQRDARRRLHSAADAALELEAEALASHDHENAEQSRYTRRLRILPWVLVAIVGVVAAIGWFGKPSEIPSQKVSLRIPVELGLDLSLPLDLGASLAFSPDGRSLAMVASSGEQQTRLYVRHLDTGLLQLVPSTTGARHPFFSPDGRWVGYAGRGQLMKTAVDGGPPIAIAETITEYGRGATWSRGDEIIYVPSFTSGLRIVSAQGGNGRTLTQTDPSRGERSHRWPSALPDGDGVLFMCQYQGRDYDQASIEIVSIRTGERKVLTTGAFPRYSLSGHLLFVRGSTLYAAPLDVSTGELTGTEMAVLENVFSQVSDQELGDGSALFDVSNSGFLVYRWGQADQIESTRLMLVDREGRELLATEGRRPYFDPMFSPDGHQLVLGIADAQDTDLWLFDSDREVLRRLTTETTTAGSPVWSPDGRFIVYRLSGRGSGVVHSVPVDGSELPTTLVTASTYLAPQSFSPDGKLLLMDEYSNDRSWNIVSKELSTSPDAPRQELFADPASETNAMISRNGKLIAYNSNETGRYEVYLARYPSITGKWQVSTDGGVNPRWSANDNELFYQYEGGVFQVTIDRVGDQLALSRPELVIDDRILYSTDVRTFDVASDGQSFAILQRTESSSGHREDSVYLISNWFDELQDAVP